MRTGVVPRRSAVVYSGLSLLSVPILAACLGGGGRDTEGSGQAADASHTWHRWQDLVRQAGLAVAPRSGFSLAQVPPPLQEWLAGALTEGRVRILPAEAQDISSTAIRRELAEQGVSGAVPPAVNEYIRQHGLYR